MESGDGLNWIPESSGLVKRENGENEHDGLMNVKISLHFL